jgi:hypothetical protein
MEPLAIEFTFAGRPILRSFGLWSFCVAILIFGIIPLLSAQQSRGVSPGPVPPQIAAAEKVSITSAGDQNSESVVDQTVFNDGANRPYYHIRDLNGAMNAGLCGSSARPAWCRGSEIGAWTNSAISVIGCGEVYIPAGTYTQTSSIVKPRCVKLHGASADSTFLKWTPTRGAAIIMGDAMGSQGFAGEGALEDLTLIGPGASTKTCGIYLGGSDDTGCAPPTAIDPRTNLDDHDNINRVRTLKLSSAGAFGVGIQFGNGAWVDTIFESSISFNGTGIYVSGTRPQTGENLTILNSAIQANVGVGLEIEPGKNVNFNLVNTSLDYNGSWAVQNGAAGTQNAVSLVNCYIAQRSRWLQNYGYMNLSGVYANDGADSGILGYLIDNEAAFFTAIGGQFFNNGTGAILNPDGVPSTWIAPLVTSPGASGFTPTFTYIDRLGDFVPSSLYLQHVNQNTANQVAGTSACSSGAQTVTFPSPFGSPPAVLVFDETTKGGISLAGKGTWGFIVSCTGASDVFDWIVIGNPN